MIFCLISYDIRDDQRRTQVHQVLKNHGNRVQFSVFECFLPDRKLQALQKRLLELIHPTVDSLRVYRLCRRCLSGVECMGVGVVPEDDTSLPVIL